MTNFEFVEAIKRHIINGVAADTINNLKSPPGRRVSTEERTRSEWYNNLSAIDEAHVNSIIATAAHDVIFGFLAALDGARTISDEQGLFELAYISKERVILNNPGSIGLHDLLNAK
jgi:hypothetical protein